MKRTTWFMMILCIILCGCENAAHLDKLEAENNISSSAIISSEINSENELNNIETADVNTNKAESREEFIERLKNVYLDIKEEAQIIGADKTQILFNEVDWTSSFLDTKNKLQKTEDKIELSRILIPEPVSVSSMLGIPVALDDRFYDSEKYYNNNVGGVARLAKRGELNVAGYEVDDCMLLFSAVSKDGIYILSEESSALYAAKYTIKPNDAKNAKNDLRDKITSIYGEPDTIREIESYANAKETNEYIYWYGSNDTVLVLYVDDYDTVHISYVWLGGEELLDAALDNAEKEQSESENDIYGNGDTSGL